MKNNSRKSIVLSVFALLVSCSATTLLSLALAFWTGQYRIFYSYFDRPLVLLLNFFPILLLQLLLLGMTGKQWISFLISALIVFVGVTANFFKMTYRKCPLILQDLSYFQVTLGVSSNYSYRFNSRMWLFCAFIIVMTAVLLLLRKKTDVEKPEIRVLIVLFVIIAGVFLWKDVYSSEKLYTSPKVCSEDGSSGINGEIRDYITKGFTYPFIYSIKEYLDIIPENYDKQDTEMLLSGYTNSVIEEEKKVNIILFQLESFSDLRRTGIENISEETYKIYDDIKKEAFYGDLLTSVFGGGTIETEHSVLTGDYSYFLAEKDIPSFVRYMAENGYATVGGHPVDTYYNRDSINRFLGFEDYRFAENQMYDGVDLSGLKPNWWYSDCVFFPSVLKQYKELSASGRNVFSFNVTMQGHGLYGSDRRYFEELYTGSDYSEATSNSLNNYLGSMKDTQKYMKEFLEELKEDEAPCIVVFYGDHIGDFTNGNQEELKSMDPHTKDGHYNMYATEYVFWANNAAKKAVGDGFVGEGPAISANYLLPLLFSKLGWEGNAYSNFLLELSETLPVITSNDFYIENGIRRFKLPEKSADMLERYRCVEYYYRFDSDEN